MRSIDPACKFVGLLMPTFFLAARPNLYANVLVFAMCLGLMLAARVRLRTLLLLLVPVALATAGLFMTGYRFAPGTGMPVNASSWFVSDSAVYNGLVLCSRVPAFSGLGLLFALTTDKILMVKSFQKRFHLPNVFAYGLLAAWGILPHMAREFRRTRAAFRARGQRALPFSPAVLKPLLVKSVRWSEELSISMESKGFSGRAPRTEFQPCLLRTRDLVFCGAALLLSLGTLLMPC